MTVSARPFEPAGLSDSVMREGVFESWSRILTESRLRAKSASSAFRPAATRPSPARTAGAPSMSSESKASFSRMDARWDVGRATRPRIRSPQCSACVTSGRARTGAVEPVGRARTDERSASRSTFQIVEKGEIEEKERGEPGRTVEKGTVAEVTAYGATPPAPYCVARARMPAAARRALRRDA